MRRTIQTWPRRTVGHGRGSTFDVDVAHSQGHIGDDLRIQILDNLARIRSGLTDAMKICNARLASREVSIGGAGASSVSDKGFQLLLIGLAAPDISLSS